MRPEREYQSTTGGGDPPVSTAPRPPGLEFIPFTVEPITIISNGITYRTERTVLYARPVAADAALPPATVPEPGPEEISLAAKVFQLLAALDPAQRLRKAPPIKVFLLRFRDGLTVRQIANICRCDKSLVAARVKAIRKTLPWSPQQLRLISSHVEKMEADLTDSRAKGIYRKGAAYGDSGDEAEFE